MKVQKRLSAMRAKDRKQGRQRPGGRTLWPTGGCGRTQAFRMRKPYTIGIFPSMP